MRDRHGLITILTQPSTGLDLVVATAISVLMLLTAAGTSYIRRTGDGQEYMAMALAVSQLDRPAPNAEQLLALEQRLVAMDAEFGANIRYANLVASDGRQDFPHFWMYPGLSAPFIAAASWLGIHPNWGFTFLNIALLAAAFASLAWVYSVAVAAFFVLGPPLWWVDKAHTEAFTAALLLMGIALLRRRPWLAVPAIGLAATQNVPIAILVPIAIAYALRRDAGLVRRRKFQIAAGLGGALAVLHPTYYLLRLGTYTSQAAMGAVDALVPDPAYLLAPLIDPNIGLIPRFPLMLPVVFVLLATASRHWRRVDWPLAATLGLVAVAWLFVFAQNANLNHGGTPAMSRYSVWLIPLVLPVVGGLASAVTSRLGSALLVIVIALSVYVSALEYHPSRPDGYYTPSWMAAWIWDNAPWLDNPPAQIFLERTYPGEVELQTSATGSCSKVLVVAGQWPPRCGQKPHLPSSCAVHASKELAMCYANRSTSGYSFAEAP